MVKRPWVFKKSPHIEFGKWRTIAHTTMERAEANRARCAASGWFVTEVSFKEK